MQTYVQYIQCQIKRESITSHHKHCLHIAHFGCKKIWVSLLRPQDFLAVLVCVVHDTSTVPWDTQDLLQEFRTYFFPTLSPAT